MGLSTFVVTLAAGLAGAAAVSRQDPVTPVSKVIDLLEDLKGQVEKEGTEEATTYDKYACFCKDKSEKKATSIIDGQGTIDTTSAKIVDDTATMEQKKKDLIKEKAVKEQAEKDLEAEKERCAKEAAEFEATLDDLKRAIFALKKAIESIEAGKPALLQVQQLALSQDALDAVKLGQALGLVREKSRQDATSLLQVDPSDPEYKFHSDSILELLGDLKTEFTDKQTKTQAEFKKAKKICDDTKKELKDTIDDAKKEIETLEKDIDKLQKDIAEARRDLVDAEAMMKDDKVYVKDLTEQCERAAVLWDQRASERAKEVGVIEEALVLLKGEKGKTKGSIQELDSDANERALLQAHQQAMPAAPAFVQQRSLSVRNKRAEADLMQQVEQLLRETGIRLKSDALTQMASKVKGDPFGKVKQMIQELIERLLDEATKEATKQGFCDKELGKAYEDRDFRLEDTKRLSAEIGVGRSKNETLAADIADLEEALPELYKALNETTEIRQTEKEENLERIKTAKEGLSAVTEAIVVLKTYYRQAAKEEFLQVHGSPVTDDLKEEGIEGPGFDSAYKGKQDGAKGVIGLLEVIKSDFDRTIRKTTAEEKQAQEEFVEFERVTKSDISGKETSLELKTQDQRKVVAKMESDLESLDTAQGLLDDALKTVESLVPMCLGWGQSYDDRVKKREEEIAALKKCLTILTPP